MGALLHDSDVVWGGVSALPVFYGVDESVPEFIQRTKKVLLDETNHAVVWRKDKNESLFDIKSSNSMPSEAFITFLLLWTVF